MYLKLFEIAWTYFIFTSFSPCGQSKTFLSFYTFPKGNTLYGSVRLGDAWTVSCLTSCVNECRERYKGCYSVVYNDDKRLCTPGGIITYGMSPPSSVFGDKFYYTDHCNTSMGYRLIVYQTTVECFHISTTGVVYSYARSNCTAIGGRVMQAKTQVRYDLFKHIARDIIQWKTFVGLTKVKYEKTFVWEDGDVLDDTWKTHIFYPGEPNGFDLEDNCVVLGQWNYFQDVYDETCNYANYPDYRYYICESVK